MTDSVRCTTDSSNAFTCEVRLDFETLTCEAPEPVPEAPPPPPPASSPAVASLVSTFASRTIVPAPSAPLLSPSALLECAPSELSVVLAATMTTGPVIGTLTMLKAAFDTGRCLTLAHNDAVQHNAENYCASQGGVVVGVEGEKTICEVRETLK